MLLHKYITITGCVFVGMPHAVNTEAKE